MILSQLPRSLSEPPPGSLLVTIAQDRKARRERAELFQLQQRYASLTPREREVLSLVVSGLLNKQAAAELGIRLVTLQLHRSKVMQKMAAKSFAELVRMAAQLRVPLTSLPVDNARPVSSGDR